MNIFGYTFVPAARLDAIEERLDTISTTAANAAVTANGAAAAVAELETDFTELGDNLTTRLDSAAITAAQALGEANAATTSVTELEAIVASMAQPIRFGTVADLKAYPDGQVPEDTLFIVCDTVANVRDLMANPPNANPAFAMTMLAGFDEAKLS